MEKEIAGKILSCLRGPSATAEEDLPCSIASDSAKVIENKKNADSKSEQMDTSDSTIYFDIGFSFTQFLAQSVDGGSKGINLDDLEEYNYNVLNTRKEVYSPR